MADITIDMGYGVLNSDYGEKVLSYYLWGDFKGSEQRGRPGDIVDEKYIDRNDNITLQFSMKEYIEKFYSINGISPREGVLKYVKNFKIFDIFFNSKGLDRNNKPLDYDEMEKIGKIVEIKTTSNFNGYEIHLTNDEFIDLYYKNSHAKEDARTPAIPIPFYTNNPLSGEEYAKSSFVFGSTKLTFNTSPSN
ncbi:hypothetical protein, partial [uncultured Campylobacter sp.]|uniref:hypothetical protein n=1 Tax=uncultured Campylobacter sp. TaxID=218934 RepID=UPI002625B255